MMIPRTRQQQHVDVTSAMDQGPKGKSLSLDVLATAMFTPEAAAAAGSQPEAG